MIYTLIIVPTALNTKARKVSLMNKLLILIVVTLSLLLTGCGTKYNDDYIPKVNNNGWIEYSKSPGKMLTRYMTLSRISGETGLQKEPESLNP